MFKRVTVKDPLSRIYAQRLISNPAPVSEGAIARPRKPGEAPPPASGGQGPAGSRGNAAQEEQQAADAFVSHVLASVGDAQAAQMQRSAVPPKRPAQSSSAQSSGAKQRQRGTAGAGSGKGKGKEKGAGAAADSDKAESMPQMGGRGRVVMNHSTHIPGLIDVLNRLAETEGIFTIVPGQLSRCA